MSFSTDYIAQLIERREYDTIAIYSANGQSAIDYATGGPNDCIECLELFVDGADNGSYQAHLYNDGKQSGSGSRTDKHRKKILRFNVGNQNGSAVGIGSSDWIEKFIQAQSEINELRTEMKIREIESKTESVGMKIFDAVMQMQRDKDKKTVSGIQGPNQIENAETDANNAELVQLLTEWQEIDPDFFDSLKGLVEMAKQNPAKYATAKKML